MRFALAMFASQLFAALALSAEARVGSDRFLYLLDNDPAGNFILSFSISSTNGTLSSGVRTSTGGYGINLLNISPQDSVHISGNYLFTANAGSNTISMFAIDPLDPLHPRLLGKPALSLGQNPSTIAYSPKINTACTANAGGGVVGVTCFSVDPMKGLKNLGPQRDIPQPSNIGAPPPGLLIGDIVFNPSSTAVFISLANSTTGPGYLYAYPIINGQVSERPVVSLLKDASAAFSLNFLSLDSRLFITNPHNGAPGALVVNVSPSLEATEVKIVTIPSQNAACWTAYTPAYNRVFVMDAVVPNITAIDSTNGNVVSQWPFVSPALGATDSLVDRNFLYVLTIPFSNDLSHYIASPQVLVYDITPITKGQNPRQIQSYDIFKATGSSYEVVGLNIWPSSRP